VRVGVPQADDFQFGQPEQLPRAFPHTEQQDDRPRPQPARHKAQDLQLGAVHPLRVIDHAQQRMPLGGVRQQTQHRQGYQEPFG
jgi:hypothetical protein